MTDNVTANHTISNDDYVQIRNIYIMVIPVMLVFCFITVVINLLILASVRWVRRDLNPTLCFSVSLAVADAYASLLVGVGLIINSLLPVHHVDLGPMKQCYVLVVEVFRLSGIIVSVLHLLALAVNHYLGIIRPLHYAATVTRCTAGIAIGIMWLAPPLFFSVYFTSVPQEGFQSEECRNHTFLFFSPFRVTFSTLFFIPLVLMTVMYGHIYVIVRRHLQGLVECPTSSRHLHKNVKAVITTLLILGTYVLGWMPAVLFYISTCLDCPVPFDSIPMEVKLPVLIMANSLTLAKSFVDPIIYVVRMPEIQNAFKRMWSTRCGLRDDHGGPNDQISRTETKSLTLKMTRNRMKSNNHHHL